MATKPKIVENCQYCRFVRHAPANPDQFVCQRHPPMPVFNPAASSTDQYTPSRWPLVEPGWWCGEFKT